MAETAAARRGITADQVYAAAESISSGGHSPTIRSVRDLLGTGSLTTIRRYLAAWRDQRPSEAAPAHEMPSDLVAAYSRELQRVADTATSAMRKDLAEARQEADDLTDAGELLESERDEALSRAEAAERSRDKLSGQVEQQVQEIERLRADLAETRKVADNLRTDLAEARNRNTTLTEQRDTAQTDLAEVRRETTETRDALLVKLNELQGELVVAERDAAVARVEAKSTKHAFDDIKIQLAEHKDEQKQRYAEHKEETKLLRLKIDELQTQLNKKQEKKQEED